MFVKLGDMCQLTVALIGWKRWEKGGKIDWRQKVLDTLESLFPSKPYREVSDWLSAATREGFLKMEEATKLYESFLS